MDKSPAEIAMEHLKSSGVECSNLAVGNIEEFDWGWVVGVNTPEYWETKDMAAMVIGLSPVFVSRSGHYETFPTGMGFDEMIKQFSEEHGAKQTRPDAQ